MKKLTNIGNLLQEKTRSPTEDSREEDHRKIRQEDKDACNTALYENSTNVTRTTLVGEYGIHDLQPNYIAYGYGQRNY